MAGFATSSVWSGRPGADDIVPDVPGPHEASDIVIVGAGILGLASALHAARSGLGVRVLETHDIGSGASGVNGGQVIPGLKYDPDKLIELFGEVRGEAVIDFAATTADRVFDLIAQERLDVPRSRAGWIQAAHTPAAVQAAQRRARQWAARGVAARILSEQGVAALTGARCYRGGWLDPRAGVIDPLAYTRELARAAIAAGARIATQTEATRLRQDGGTWHIDTAGGVTLRAGSVIVATNAYADRLVPGLPRTILPLHSFQIATEPLPPALGASILPGGQAVSDSRRILVYYRKTPDGRLMLGGRGPMTEPKSADDWLHLKTAMTRLFPQLGSTPIANHWFGRVAVTLDHLPHVHEPARGLLLALGCQGRGIGLMTALGPRLVDYTISRNAEVLPFPLTPVRPIPFHRFRNLGVGAAIAWYRMIDGIDVLSRR